MHRKLVMGRQLGYAYEYRIFFFNEDFPGFKYILNPKYKDLWFLMVTIFNLV